MTMRQSALEMATDLVIAQLTTFYRSPKAVERILTRTHAYLMRLQQHEATDRLAPIPSPSAWQRSITPLVIICLECGASVKQLSERHLRAHGLDAHTYRVKYGMPSTQALAATPSHTAQAHGVRPNTALSA